MTHGRDGEPFYPPPPVQPPAPDAPQPQPYAPQPPPWAPLPGEFGYAATLPPRVSAPVLGWVLLGVGALMLMAAMLPWARIPGRSLAGTEGDGAVTLVFAVVIGAMGLVIGLRQGRLWASIVACALGAITTLTAVADIGNVSHDADQLDAALGLHVSVGVGLWLTLLTGIAAAGLSVAAIIWRARLPRR